MLLNFQVKSFVGQLKSFLAQFRKKQKLVLTISTVFLIVLSAFNEENPKTLPIGSKAPDFKLKNIDGTYYTLESFNKAKILVVIFTCNHCPTAQAYEERIKELTRDYKSKGVEVVAIMPNYSAALRYDELGWSDEPDDFEGMKNRARDKEFNFPYLYDGDSEETSLKFGPVSTPHVFIFDQERILRYSGRIDDEENFRKPIHSQDTRNAIDALLANKPVPVETTKTFGCSIKWKSKTDWMEKANAQWEKLPVKLSSANEEDVEGLFKNEASEKLRLIYVWSMHCTACETSLPEFLLMSRIYQERDFELVTICADDSTSEKAVLSVLEDQHSPVTNYWYAGKFHNRYTDAILQRFKKNVLPYSFLVEPGGKVKFFAQGEVDPDMLRRKIFEDPMIGRLFK